MKKKSFLLSLVLSFCFMSFKIPDTVVIVENNILLYVIIGVCIVLIFGFLFFISQNIKIISDRLSSSNTDDSQNAKFLAQESGNSLADPNEDSAFKTE